MRKDMEALLYNSLTEGDFGNGLLLLQSLTEGDFWTLPDGCFAVYRGEGHIDDIDYEKIMAVSFTTGPLPLPSRIEHDAETDYFYAARRISGTGKAELGTCAVVKLALDEQSKQRSPRPGAVQNLQVQLGSDGQIRLSWYYISLGRAAVPEKFVVYGDNGSGSVDYENALAEISYTGRYYYRYEGDAGEEAGELRFSVRAVAPDGNDDGNTALVVVRVDRTGPGSVEGVQGRVGL
jgi:hypothetical protein